MTFIENVVKYTNVMQYVKENVADIIILILLAVWGIYEVLMIPLRYSFTFMIALLGSLKIVEVLREHTFDIDGIKVIFIGIFLQSAYFLIVKLKCSRNYER